MHDKLIKDWIALQKATRNSEEYDRLFWAFDTMVELASKNPQECLQVVVTILNETHDDNFILANLAAGPLEDLLVAHGAELIDTIESLSSHNTNFQKLLGGVWKNDIPDEIWAHVKAVAGPPL